MGGGPSQANRASADPNQFEASKALQSLNSWVNQKGSSQVQDLLQKYAAGQVSYADAMAAAKAAPSSGPSHWVDKAGNIIPNETANLYYDSYRKEAGWTPVGGSSGSEDLSRALSDAIATDPATASKFASEFVRNDALTKGYFGEGGLQDKTLALQDALQAKADQSRGAIQSSRDRLDAYSSLFEGDRARLDESRNALMGRDSSYGLTSEDLAAYGQAAGKIARQFGQSEASLAQALANRGLAAGASGVAQQSFSNLQGNKLEQLAGMQTQIAQNRIQSAMQLAQARAQADQARYASNIGLYGQDVGRMGADISAYGQDVNRLGQNSQLAYNLGVLGQNALTNQFNRQLQGSQNTYNQMAGAAGMAMQNQGLQQNINNANWQQVQDSSIGLGDILGGAGSAIFGGIGKGVGSAIGGLFGSDKK